VVNLWASLGWSAGGREADARMLKLESGTIQQASVYWLGHRATSVKAAPSPLSRFYYRPLTPTHVTPSRDSNLELLTGVNIGTPASAQYRPNAGRRFYHLVVCNSARSNSPRPAPDRDTACNFRATWPPEVDRWWRVTSLEKSRETRLSFRPWADESFQIENLPLPGFTVAAHEGRGLSVRWKVRGQRGPPEDW